MKENKEAKKELTLFEKEIKKYLDDFAKTSPEFAEKYANEKKSIQECCAYIGSIMREKANNGITIVEDDEVYYLARHYYDEDELKVENKYSIQNYVHSKKELTEEEKNEAIKRGKEEAEKELERIENEAKKKEIERLKKAKEAKIAKEKKKAEEQGQMSLFDF